MEALLAAVVLMGAFAVMLLTGDKVALALDVLLPEKKRKWKCGVTLLAVFALENGVRLIKSGVMDIAGTVFWGLAPILALWVVFSGKREKIAETP